MKKMKIGDPLSRSTDHGPQNHRTHMEKLLKYCKTGVEQGATLVYGGKQVARPGTVYICRMSCVHWSHISRSPELYLK